MNADLNRPGDGESELPTIVQASSAPVFSMGGEDDLACAGCGGILVLGMLPQTLVSVGIECYVCKTLYRGESWPEGEPLPFRTVSMGRTGRYLIKDTVRLDGLPVTITSDQEIERVAAATGIRAAYKGPLEMSEAQVAKLVDRLDTLTDGNLRKGLLVVERAEARGNRRHISCLSAWAIHRLTECLRKGAIDFSTDDGVALRLYNLIVHFVSRWEHHHSFPAFAKGLVSEFHHTLGMLVAASYMADHNNRIGFTDARRVAGRSPDLFLNLGGTQKASIEIKAPAPFQWPNAVVPGSSVAQAIIARALKDARGQLGDRGGVVIIVANSLQIDLKGVTEDAAKELVARNMVSGRIAAIVGVCQSSFGLQHLAAGQVRLDGHGHVWVCENPRYTGPIRLITTSHHSV